MQNLQPRFMNAANASRYEFLDGFDLMMKSSCSVAYKLCSLDMALQNNPSPECRALITDVLADNMAHVVGRATEQDNPRDAFDWLIEQTRILRGTPEGERIQDKTLRAIYGYGTDDDKEAYCAMVTDFLKTGIDKNPAGLQLVVA